MSERHEKYFQDEELRNVAQQLQAVSTPHLSSDAKRRIATELGVARKPIFLRPLPAVAGFATICLLVVVVVAQAAKPGATLYSVKQQTHKIRTVIQPGFQAPLPEADSKPANSSSSGRSGSGSSDDDTSRSSDDDLQHKSGSSNDSDRDDSSGSSSDDDSDDKSGSNSGSSNTSGSSGSGSNSGSSNTSGSHSGSGSSGSGHSDDDDDHEDDD